LPSSALQLDLEGGEEHEGGQRGGAEGVTLGDGLGGVADGIERVRDVADLLGHVRHLGDAPASFGDRTERVEGERSGRRARAAT